MSENTIKKTYKLRGVHNRHDMIAWAFQLANAVVMEYKCIAISDGKSIFKNSKSKMYSYVEDIEKEANIFANTKADCVCINGYMCNHLLKIAVNIDNKTVDIEVPYCKEQEEMLGNVLENVDLEKLTAVA